ncbi:MAG: transglutaminase family protein [Hyphomicrobium sp.]|nr:transglutaminase family protein [Hyphomicrobium sp.]
MLINYGFSITLSVTQPTPILTRLDVVPDRRADIAEEGRFMMSGADVAAPNLDVFGNHCRRIVLAPGDTKLELTGIIRDSGQHERQLRDEPLQPVQALPDEVLPFLVASRYCESDILSAEAWQLFGKYPETAARVRAIVDFAHAWLTFGYPYARDTRTAAEAMRERVGVCRDFAHLTIALCRAMNIPARYVNGYLGDIGVPVDPAPMDFSAWVEVFVGGRWYTVDARHNEPRIGRIVIARGRDAADVPMVHSFGAHVLKQFMVVTDEIADSAGALRRAA